ncbi:MAG: carboxypeptidase-like regulatory domain-containing protein [Bacteroidales bacterium]|nr:carboxypeptidase-like regulatory domain-containing protein [Bacteroidales bacterium]
MKKYALVLLFLILQSTAFAHHGHYRVSGRVLDKATGETLPVVPVQIRGLGIFTVTDMHGRFSFNAVPSGEQVFVVQHLGHQTLEEEISVTGAMDDLRLQLNPQSLTLESVEVTAQRGTGMSTSSVIGAQAIEHVQAVSIRDIMQLVPGAVTQNTNLTDRNLINIRSISNTDATNALGTAIIMDGATISNSANMQTFRYGQTVTNMGRGEGDPISTAHTGLDVREISVDNIESIEIVRGIPSVEHGNATAGAVLIRSRAGVTPLNIRFTTNPHLTQFSAGQGIRLGGNAGILNIGLDYANAIRRLISPTEAFNRFSVTTAYSNTFGNLTFNARLVVDYNRASNKNDPDNNLGELERLTNQGLRLNIHGAWTMPTRINTTIEYVLSGSIREQNDFFRRRTTGAHAPMTNSTVTGMNQGFFIPAVYHSELTISGLPMNFQARVTARRFRQYGIFTNRVMAGAEFRSDGNRGRGRIFDPELPHARTAIRDRSFREFPFIHNLSLFADNRFGVQLGETKLEFLAGLRFNYILPNEKFELTNAYSVNPQASVNWTIIDRGATSFRHLSFRGGWGVLTQMPTMAFLFPEPIFLDEILFRHGATETSIWYTTRLDPKVNPDLRMPRNVKWEFGTDFQIQNVRGEITFFHEYMTNGLQFLLEHRSMGFNRWFLPNGNPLTFDGNPQFHFDGQRLWRIDGGRNEEVLTQSQDTSFFGNRVAANGEIIRKWGIEYSFNLGTIRALRTSVNIDGAYFRIKNTDNAMRELLPSGRTWQNRHSQPFVVSYFIGGTSTNANNGRIRERLNTNFRLITHIPRVGIVTTVTFQAIWLDADRFINSRAYFFDVSGGDTVRRFDVWNNRTETVFVNPVKIRDHNGNMRYFTEEDERDPFYAQLRLTSNAPIAFVRQRWSPYGMINVRVTKEINRNASISFFANNVLDLEGRARNNVTGQQMARVHGFPLHTTLQFGAEVRLRF